MDLAAPAPRGRRRHPSCNRGTQPSNEVEGGCSNQPFIFGLTVAAQLLSGHHKLQWFPRLPDRSHWPKIRSTERRSDWQHASQPRPIGQSRAGGGCGPWFSQVTSAWGHSQRYMAAGLGTLDAVCHSCGWCVGPPQLPQHPTLAFAAPSVGCLNPHFDGKSVSQPTANRVLKGPSQRRCEKLLAAARPYLHPSARLSTPCSLFRPILESRHQRLGLEPKQSTMET
jgi:hypothetical protein